MSDFGCFAYFYILVTCFVGFAFGIYNYKTIMKIEILANKTEEGRTLIDDTNVKNMNIIAEKIQKGSNTFLTSEFTFLFLFVGVFSLIIIGSEGFRFLTAFAFILGSVTSVFCGYIGMYIATRTNYRVTYMAGTKGLGEAFVTAFRGGSVLGFCLVSLGLAVLTILIITYVWLLEPKSTEDFIKMFEFIAGYGLGGSTVALFCRVGGGIFTKAADVGADLVGKVCQGLNEDSIDNPGTIADNVGDNVGDIAGMGSDLFGSFAESTCAALVISGTSEGLIENSYFLFPLLLSASGIIVCIITSLFATSVCPPKQKKEVEEVLKTQLIISTLILIPTILFLGYYTLPESFEFVSGNGDTLVAIETFRSGVMICAISGLVAGLIIGYLTDYYTSNANEPTQELSRSCRTGAAINIIQGLALGYLSTIVPILAIAVTIFTSFKLAGMYGIAIAALGMLSNLAIALTIDGYGPISDNAGGISEMCNLPTETREITDALDAAGNTTAAVGKGFAIGSACLVSLALFGAFITRTDMTVVNILEPIMISCLLVGAMIPYAFSALTMKSVGVAANKMCEEIKSQFNSNQNDPDKCIKIATEASLREMILPGILVSNINLGYFHSISFRRLIWTKSSFRIFSWCNCFWSSSCYIKF